MAGNPWLVNEARLTEMPGPVERQPFMTTLGEQRWKNFEAGSSVSATGERVNENCNVNGCHQCIS